MFCKCKKKERFETFVSHAVVESVEVLICFSLCFFFWGGACFMSLFSIVFGITVDS